MRTLTVNGVQLLDRIDPNDAFVDELGAVGCITWPQTEHIINLVQPRDRNDKLLEFLTRRSVVDFNKFIKVLAEEQPHLVCFLVTDGGETYSRGLFEHEVYPISRRPSVLCHGVGVVYVQMQKCR